MTLEQKTASRRLGTAVRLSSYADTADDFPTPPWATRAFVKYVAPELKRSKRWLILEPACGRGHMADTLREYGWSVSAYDKFNYNNNKIADYTTDQYGVHDLIITNPPYKLANVFVERGLREARVGVGVLMRTIWLEGAGRYDKLFKPYPPTRVAVFSRRMQATHGKVIQRGAAMMSHTWFWWDLRQSLPRKTELIWLPPTAQVELERLGDYA